MGSHWTGGMTMIPPIPRDLVEVRDEGGGLALQDPDVVDRLHCAREGHVESRAQTMTTGGGE